MHKTRTDPSVFARATQLMQSLFDSETQTPGSPSILEPLAQETRKWAERILVDMESFLHHVALLQAYFKTVFHRPENSTNTGLEATTPSGNDPNSGFPYRKLLSPETTEGILQMGLPASDEELAPLLLNPCALYALVEKIDFDLPDYWLARMGEVAMEIDSRPSVSPASRNRVRERTCAVPFEYAGTAYGSSSTPANSHSWMLQLGKRQALREKICEHLFDDRDQHPALILVAQEEETGVRFQLAVSPQPMKRECTLEITFPSGDHRVFTVSPEDRVGGEARSHPCEPLPRTAWNLEGRASWEPGAWPPHLIFEPVSDSE